MARRVRGEGGAPSEGCSSLQMIGFGVVDEEEEEVGSFSSRMPSDTGRQSGSGLPWSFPFLDQGPQDQGSGAGWLSEASELFRDPARVQKQIP